MTAKRIPPDLLDMTEAAEALGVQGRWRAIKAKRFLLAREQTLGRPVLSRFGGTAKGTRYRVSKAALIEACPEFFSERDRAAEAIAETMAGIRAELAELRSRIEVVASHARSVVRALRAAGIEVAHA